MYFGKNIKYLIKQLKINQLELGNRIGVGQSRVSGWASESSYPDFQMLLKLRAALDVNLHDLILTDLSNNPILSNQLKETEVKYKTGGNTEGVKIEVINNEREMYERLLKEKDALIKQQIDMIDTLKETIKILRG